MFSFYRDRASVHRPRLTASKCCAFASKPFNPGLPIKIRRPFPITEGHMLPKILAVLLLCSACAFAQTDIPKTPAGQVLADWLDAFNSGDAPKIAAFVKARDPKHPDGFIVSAGFRNQTGGFDLVAIENSAPRAISFRVKEKNSATVAFGSISVSDAQPATIDDFSLNAIPPGTKEENIKLDASERGRVIDGAIAQLKDFYIYPDIAQKMGDAILVHQKNGDYDSITDGGMFARKLTADLQDVSRDKHLHVNYAPYVMAPDHEGGPSPKDMERFRKDMEHDNCAFDKVEILPGNIGYVKFNAFAPPEICGPTVVAAMAFVAHADALIFDLRENGGGDPKMVDTIVSYLFDSPTHVNDLYDRKKDETTQYWTLPYLPGARMAKQPVFVLTSSHTFSGGEEFCYDLQTQKRATLVGEVTGGGAHPVSGHRIDDHFGIGVPFARAINPVTKLDWEGTGVKPDVAVPAADALDTAEKLAEAKLHNPDKPDASTTAAAK